MHQSSSRVRQDDRGNSRDDGDGGDGADGGHLVRRRRDGRRDSRHRQKRSRGGRDDGSG